MEKTVYITGAEPNIDLQYSDAWLPGLYSRRIMCFELPEGSSHEKAIDVVERGLKALVDGTPELAAEAVTVQNAAPHDPKQPWRALVKGKGIQLVIKDMKTSSPSYKKLEAAGFPLSAFKDSAFMPIDGAILPEPQPESVFQLSLIEGGVLMSVCLYHRLSDGNGMNSISRALGDECKLAATTKDALPPRKLDTDRSIMASLNGGKTDLKDHPAHTIMDQVFNPNTHHDDAPPEANGEEPAPPPPRFVPAYFRLTHEKAQALKDYCSRDTPVSTHDAISALLWRNLIKTRLATGELNPSTLSTFTVPHNARKHVGLPPDWIGNCVYFIQAQAQPSEIASEDSPPKLAAMIRKALNTVDFDHMSGISTIRRKDPYSLNWWPITCANNPEIVAITSFYHSGLMGYDFGPALGKVKHFTSTDIGAFGAAFQRAHFVGPKFEEGRGCDVHVGLLEGEVEEFYNDELWKKYFTLLETGEGVDGGGA